VTSAYAGTELELFATATHWKSYVAASLRPYIRGRVLDVGAGLGGNIRHLINPAVTAWTALEPDPRLASVIESPNISDQSLAIKVVTGTIDDFHQHDHFETILYMDVLEHIADDRAEIQKVVRLLAPGGNLVVLAPAHQFLFSPFDAAIGHFRRYSLQQLRNLVPTGFRTELCRLIDCVGFFASLGNRMVLRQSQPTASQIAIWDRFMVRASRLLDPIVGYRIGKSALIVCRAPEHRVVADRQAC
jgi:SAM-dependent methyltransferase